MFHRTKISRGVLLALGSALLAATGASAQDTQRIEITGSSIKRTDSETASPVQLITKGEIDQAGKGTVAEFLQTLTADGQGSVPFTYGRGFSGATASGISLRGLGANATLVLVNGRRVATAVLADDFQRSFVDLNQIPMEAVERIEVLKDGASSTYGSDAVAGVVNIILKKSFKGTVGKVTYGVAQEGDGKEPRVALTHGFGDLGSDGYNVLLNLEAGKRDPIYYRDRAGRGSVGVSAVGQAPWNFDPNGSTNNIGTNGGNGWIPTDAQGARLSNTASTSIIGSIRNPATNLYYSRGDTSARTGFARTFADAQTFCNANANLPQNDPMGGCLIDARQALNQIQPKSETYNLFGRLTKSFGGDLEGFVEGAYYHTKSRVDGLPIAPSGAYNTITGSVSRAATSLGATHPDNPYNATARIRYLPLYDTGISGTDSQSGTKRVQAGLKGLLWGWDFDTAISWSESRQTDTATRVMDWRVADALLNPTTANVTRAAAFNPKYAALPAGTFWRIGENAKLNSAAMYDALLTDKSRNGRSTSYGADLKLSRELGKLEGGAIGVAFGVEARHEETKLGLYDGLGNYIGLSLTSYEGKRDIGAAFGEVLLPVLKGLEVTGALRVDNYSDAGTSTTPKLGVKWKALDSLALRATVAKGFRAPSAPEVSPRVVATFGGTTVNDNVRCAAGVPSSACLGVSPTFAATGNPDLKPEKSTSGSVGLVWDITPKTGMTADLWRIKRTGLPVTGDGQAALNAGKVLRDPSTAVTPTDPGAIVNVFVGYENSDQSLTSGFDIELKHRLDFAGAGRLTGTVNWSHLLKQQVLASGVLHDYAGTHGDCNITNCIGSPRDKLTFATTWDTEVYRVGANISYRGPMKNIFEKSDTECAQTTASGADFPSGCKVKSFTVLDLSGAWKFAKNSEVFGSIQNITDRKPPPDFETYGAVGYNPLDYSGAIGRFFRLGVKYQF